MAKQNTTTALARLAELHKNFELDERAKLKTELEKHVDRYEGSSTTTKRKHMLYGLVVAMALLIVISIYTAVRSYLLPSQLLKQYEIARLEGDLSLATTTINEYLSVVQDDWELFANHSYYLLENGDLSSARILYGKLLNNSPLADDVEIRYAGAISALYSGSTRNKMNEIVIILDKFIPALAARVLLETTEFNDDAQADIVKALVEYEKLDKSGDTYQRYQQLLKLFIVNSCRVISDSYAGHLLPGYDLYPKVNEEKDLLLFGLDARMSINFCTVVPSSYEDLESFNPDLGSMLYAIKSFNEIRAEQYNDALRSATFSLTRGPIAMGSFLEGILLAAEGRYNEAELSFLRTGTRNSQMLINRSNVKLLANNDEESKDTTLLEDSLKFDKNNAQAQNNLAVLSLLDGRFGQAKKWLENVAKTSPSYVLGLYNLAVTQLLLEEYQEANDNFLSFAGQEQYFPGIDYYIGISMFEAGNTESALASLKAATRSSHFGTFANLKLGDFYSSESGGEKDALAYYRTAFAADPNSYETGLKSLLMLAKIGDVSEALSQLDKIERQFAEKVDNPDYQKYLLATKGEIHYLSGLDDAEQYLIEALELATDDSKLYKHIVILYNDELLKKGKVREALDLTRTALPTDPSDTSLLLARAKALIESNDLNQALDIVDQAEKEHVNNPDIMLTRARILGKDHRLEQAAKLYQEIYELNPVDVSPLEEALVFLEQFDDQAENVAQLKGQIERAQFSSPSIINEVSSNITKKALTEKEIAKIEEDIENLDNLISSDQIEPFSGYLYRGYLLSQVGKINEAISDFKIAIEHIAAAPAKEAFQPFQRLTELYLRIGLYENALKSVNDAISKNPPSDLLNSMILTRAGVNEKLGKFDNAISDYSEIIDIFPSHLPSYLQRCQLYLKKSEIEKAIADCSTAINIDPKNIVAYQARHSAYGLLGDTAKAAKDARILSSLQISPNQQ